MTGGLSIRGCWLTVIVKPERFGASDRVGAGVPGLIPRVPSVLFAPYGTFQPTVIWTGSAPPNSPAGPEIASYFARGGRRGCGR